MAVDKQKLLAKADGLAREKKLKKAIALYRQVVAEDSADIRTRLRLSELLYQEGRLDEALEVLLYVGDYYRDHGFLLKAVAVYKKMLEVDPSHTELHGTLAQLYFQLGMAPDAIRQFKAQIRALVKQGRIRDSLFIVRSMLELDPANVTDRLRLAENFSRHELIDEAAAEYRRVLSQLDKGGRGADWGRVAMRYLHHNPDDLTVRRRVVEHLVQEGDYHRALQHLAACIEKTPDDSQLLEMAASCFEMLGQPEKAIVVLKSMVASFREKGLAKEEQEAYCRILQLDPKDDGARRALKMDVEETGPDLKDGVELEWDLPAAPEPAPAPTEFADTLYEEAPSFAEEWASEEATVVEPLTGDRLRELMGDDEELPLTMAVDILRLRRALEQREPLTAEQLQEAGVTLSANDREELEFFLSSGLRDEALAILGEQLARLG